MPISLMDKVANLGLMLIHIQSMLSIMEKVNGNQLGKERMLL